jgi:hypothetical protein
MHDLEFLPSRSTVGPDLDGLFIVHPDSCNDAPGELTEKPQKKGLRTPD